LRKGVILKGLVSLETKSLKDSIRTNLNYKQAAIMIKICLFR